MDWESFDVVRFDHEPLLQGQIRMAKVKSAYNLLIIGPTCLQCETQVIGNHGLDLLMWSDLTLGPSFKVKR